MKKTCFHNLLLFTGLEDTLARHQAVIVEGDRISAVEDQAGVLGRPDLAFIDLQGLTMLPGLIDAHIHPTVPLALELNPKVILQMGRQVDMNFAHCLKYGVTTIRDVASFCTRMMKRRQKIEAGQMPGPRVLSALTFITSPGGVPEMAPTLNPVAALIAGGQFVARCRRPRDVERAAETNAANGADWLKTQYSEQSFLFHGRLNNLSDDCFAALMGVSKKRGLPVTLHHTERAGFKKGLEIGVHCLEHCSLDALDPADVDRMVEQGVCIVPTIKAVGDFTEIKTVLDWLSREGRADFMPEPYRQTVEAAEGMLKTPYPPPDYRTQFYPDTELFERGYPNILKNVETIKRAGGRIGVGTDSCGTGLGFSGQYWKELEHLTRAGFSNAEALRAATSVNADIIGLGDRVGSIEPGKYADFTIVEGNPLEDIRAVGNVRMVYKGGRNVYGR